MVNFGFIDEWRPNPGKLTSWSVTPQSLEAAMRAPRHATPPSHQQEEYLRTAYRTASPQWRGSRLCTVVFTVPGVADLDALTQTFNAFLRRHDTFSSWFAQRDDGSIVRHVIDPDIIDVAPTEHGYLDSVEAIHAQVESGTPNALRWDCFTFGVIEHEGSFTLYGAVDHLHTDGMAQGLTCVDLLTLYGNVLSAGKAPSAPVDGHIAFSERERAATAQLTWDSPKIKTWVDLLQRNGGDIPGFPADLGVTDETTNSGSAFLDIELATEGQMLRFEQVCAEHGGRFIGGLFAAQALAEAELSGNDWYFGLTPANTRATSGEAGSVGWYTSLVPVAFDVAPQASFSSLVPVAQQAQESGRELNDVSLYRAFELVTPDSGIRTRPGWSARMLSFVDVRKMEGVEMFDKIDGGFFASRGNSTEVYIWVNRFIDVTKLSVMFPDTPQAHAAIGRFQEIFRGIFATVAAEGDYAMRVDVLS
ncbi:condensation domain-containing protein [Nocardia callitridis]|uniref:Condensation domain-containing protein n=1 Tax=Nocardia callitridis TaxID=648753 RepID=A0ABP9KPM3_9NOCA